MAIGDAEIVRVVSEYLERFPEEVVLLAEPLRLLAEGRDFACRRTFPMHVTVGALLVRGQEVLLVEHLAYGITLQPGGHLEPHDVTLIGAAERELVEETGVDPDQLQRGSDSAAPVYIEFGQVPARPAKGEPAHFHLDIGFAFTTLSADVGTVQRSEVAAAAWYLLPVAERLVGSRIARAVTAPA